MNKTNLLKEATATLKALFSSVAKLSLSQFEDADGKIYQYSVLEVGAEVFVATADGSELAPNGEYKVDELTTIKVEDGKITEVIKIEEEVEGQPEVIEVESPIDFKGQLKNKLKGTGKFEDAEIDALLEDIVASPEEMEAKVEEVADTEAESELLQTLVDGVSALIEEVKEVKADLDEAEAKVEVLEEAFSAISKQPAKESKLPKSVSSIVEPNKEGNFKELQSIFSSMSKK